jgi:hypothetical protein
MEVPANEGLWRWPVALTCERGGQVLILIHGTSSNLAWRINFR